MTYQKIHILRQLDFVLKVALLAAIVGELIFFPTLANFFGCFMSIISYLIFSYFLKERYIRLFPFSFLIYLSMFMYRYLPLVATIIEGKPITYGFERPYQTFLFETLLFVISSLAFFLACNFKGKFQNNFLQNSLNKIGFFDVNPTILWVMGGLGLCVRLYNFSSGDVEYGDVGGKFLLGLDYLMYAPLCLFFPEILKLKYANKKTVWIYTALIFILNIASNSRRQIIIPIGTLVILFFLMMVIKNLKIKDYISTFKLLSLSILFVFILNLLSNISLAMLHTRKLRDDVDKLELFKITLEVAQDEYLMEELKRAKELDEEELISYEEGWTEKYIDNFMLARYANMRITDETLYLAEKKGYANEQMLRTFQNGIIALLPTPVLNVFGIYIDKTGLEFSRGDQLYGSGFGGYRVTSHIGDGLATFGYWYLPLQFLAFYIIFSLLNLFVFQTKGIIIYAPFALMNVFTFLGKFRNAQGISGDIGYILRGFLEGIVTYLIVFYFIRLILRIVSPELIKRRYS